MKKIVSLMTMLSGGITYQTPSYDNTGGTGDRTAIITVTTNNAAGRDPMPLVNGSKADTTFWFAAQDVTDKYLTFQFDGPKIITEAKWWQDGSQEQGRWKWQGSHDGSAWADIGAEFDVALFTGAEAPYLYTTTTLGANVTAYTYYRILGVSGTSSSGPYFVEVEFKIGNQQ